MKLNNLTAKNKDLKQPYLPLVSLCMPTFNGSKFLKEALGSVKSQTYKNIEVIVSDDYSKDNTLEIVEEFKNEVNLPVYVFKHQPQGIGANWNNCVIHANGELIKFLFQDDLLEPTCIEEMVNPFLEKKNLGLVFSKRKIIFDSYNKEHIAWIEKYGNLHKAWRKIKPIQKGRSLLRDPNLLKEPENKVGEPTSVLLSKRVFERVGFFDTNLKQALDLEFWYRMFTKFDVAFIDKELVSFRLHDDQASAKNARSQIKDYLLFPELIYKNCFFYLHRSLQWEFFKKYNAFGKIFMRGKEKSEIILNKILRRK